MEGNWLVCETVADDLSRLDGVLEPLTEDSDPELGEMLRHLLSRGGKRLRPALVLLAANSAPAGERSLRAAAAVEIIHVASLHHDDVMDRAELRRGAEAVSRRWGNAKATLSGIMLYARAHRALEPLGEEALGLAASASTRLCAGQLRESENAFNQALSLEEHLTVLDEKTATLFELAVRLGALAGGIAPSETEALAGFARGFGRAFQIRDDLLDWTGSANEVGKATKVDLRTGLYSLPLLLALRAGDDNSVQLEAILRKRALSEEDVADVANLVAPSIADAQAYLQEASSRAHGALGTLAPGPRRQSFENLIAHCAVRTR